MNEFADPDSAEAARSKLRETAEGLRGMARTPDLAGARDVLLNTADALDDLAGKGFSDERAATRAADALAELGKRLEGPCRLAEN
ncbi:hypothetical protein [Actinokineospora terrae]|uniref:hypothetical protein n=1 Tax=Actinokineospora terrae TaxID=155974 RepID=UPI0011603472|nr:hypothetical protein [Actinokineospora terrae]